MSVIIKFTRRELDELIMGLRLNVDKVVKVQKADAAYVELMQDLAQKLALAHNRLCSRQGDMNE